MFKESMAFFEMWVRIVEMWTKSLPKDEPKKTPSSKSNTLDVAAASKQQFRKKTMAGVNKNQFVPDLSAFKKKM